MTTMNATDYINAAARCIYMRRLYMSDGSAKMMQRAENAGKKCRGHIESAAKILGISYDEARLMVSDRYRARFL